MKTVGQQHKILLGVLFGVLVVNASVTQTAFVTPTSEANLASLGEAAGMRSEDPSTWGSRSNTLPYPDFDFIRTSTGGADQAQDVSYSQQIRCQAGDHNNFSIPSYMDDWGLDEDEDMEFEEEDEEENRPGRRSSVQRPPSQNPKLNREQLIQVATTLGWVSNVQCSGETNANTITSEPGIRYGDRSMYFGLKQQSGLTCPQAAAPTQAGPTSLNEVFARRIQTGNAQGTPADLTGQSRMTISFRADSQGGYANISFERLLAADADIDQLVTQLGNAIRDEEKKLGDIVMWERQVRTCEYRWRNSGDKSLGVVRAGDDSTYARRCRMARIQNMPRSQRVREFQSEIAEYSLAARNGDPESLQALRDLGCSDSLPRELRNMAMARYLSGEVMTDLRGTFNQNCRRDARGDMNCDRNILLAAGAIGDDATMAFGTLGRTGDVDAARRWTMARAAGVQDSWQSADIANAVAQSLQGRQPGAELNRYSDGRTVIDNSIPMAQLRMTRAQGSTAPQAIPSSMYPGLQSRVIPTRGSVSPITRL